MKPKIYGNAVKHYLKLAKGMQAIAYTYNVDSAIKLANAFNGYGITARAVSGKTPKEAQTKLLRNIAKEKSKL